MSTARKLISDVRSFHKLLSIDSSITDRAILSEIRNSSLLLIKRESNLRKLWATDTIFTTIPCLELIEVPISECCEYVESSLVARTKYKLPSIAEGNYQYLIQGVYSINAQGGKGTKLKEITINRYLNLLKLPILKKEEYYWITNDYLYISSSSIKSVRFTALFEEEVSYELMFPDCGCGDREYSEEELCKNPLDREFALPGYLEKQVTELVSQKLLGTYFQVKTDIASEGIDGQAPNAPNLK